MFPLLKDDPMQHMGKIKSRTELETKIKDDLRFHRKRYRDLSQRNQRDIQGFSVEDDATEIVNQLLSNSFSLQQLFAPATPPEECWGWLYIVFCINRDASYIHSFIGGQWGGFETPRRGTLNAIFREIQFDFVDSGFFIWYPSLFAHPILTLSFLPLTHLFTDSREVYSVSLLIAFKARAASWMMKWMDSKSTHRVVGYTWNNKPVFIDYKEYLGEDELIQVSRADGEKLRIDRTYIEYSRETVSCIGWTVNDTPIQIVLEPPKVTSRFRYNDERMSDMDFRDDLNQWFHRNMTPIHIAIETIMISIRDRLFYEVETTLLSDVQKIFPILERLTFTQGGIRDVESTLIGGVHPNSTDTYIYDHVYYINQHVMDIIRQIEPQQTLKRGELDGRDFNAAELKDHEGIPSRVVADITGVRTDPFVVTAIYHFPQIACKFVAEPKRDDETSEDFQFRVLQQWQFLSGLHHSLYEYNDDTSMITPRVLQAMNGWNSDGMPISVPPVTEPPVYCEVLLPEEMRDTFGTSLHVISRPGMKISDLKARVRVAFGLTTNSSVTILKAERSVIEQPVAPISEIYFVNTTLARNNILFDEMFLKNQTILQKPVARDGHTWLVLRPTQSSHGS